MTKSMMLGMLSVVFALVSGCKTTTDTNDAGTGSDAATSDGGVILLDDGGMCDIPQGPYGTRVGAKFAPITLNTCDNQPYEFYNQDFCSAKLTVFGIAAGWCGPCMQESMQLHRIISQGFAGRVRLIQTLIQDPNYRAPNSAFCNQWKTTYGLTNTELMDPSQLTNIYFPDGSLPSTVIVDGDGIIQYRENGVSENLQDIVDKLNQLLGT